MPVDPYHQGGKRISAQQLKILTARHGRRVKRQKATAAADAAAANDPARVTEPLTPQSLAAQAQATTAAQFGPQEAELGRQRGISDTQQANISSWYKDYQAKLADLTNRSQQDYGQVQGQVQNAATSSAALDTTERQRVDQAAQADAQSRGGVVDPSLSAQAGQASLARNALINSFGAQLASQGVTNRDFSRAQEGAAGKQGIEQHLKEAANRSQIERNASDVASQKGAFAAKTAGDLRESERKYLLEQAAFGLNQAKAQDATTIAAQKAAADAKKAQQTAAHQNKQDRLAAKRDSTTRRGQDLTHEDRVAAQQKAAADKKKKSGTTPTQRRSYNQQYDKAKARVRGKNITVETSQAAVDQLVQEGVPRVLASIAVRQAVGMPIGGGLQKQARKLGVKVSKQAGKRPTHGQGTAAIPGVGAVSGS